MNNEEIINKVANSGLINIDLSNYAPKEEILELDIKQFLFKGLILKEKEFRSELKNYDFKKYKKKHVALHCGTNTVIPMWAYMLITMYLSQVNATVNFGNKQSVFQSLMLENINSIEADDFLEKRVLVNGCSTIELNESLYIAITKKLQNKVKSLMFGEACSAVPIYKRRK